MKIRTGIKRQEKNKVQKICGQIKTKKEKRCEND